MSGPTISRREDVVSKATVFELRVPDDWLVSARLPRIQLLWWILQLAWWGVLP